MSAAMMGVSGGQGIRGHGRTEHNSTENDH
jgi:hypothetical protein